MNNYMKSIAFGIFNYEMIKALQIISVKKERRRNFSINKIRCLSIEKKLLSEDILINPGELEITN